MDSKPVDVNKLLQQLEELKRKKARSEKKLKKLAKCLPKVKLSPDDKKTSHDLPQESKAVCNQVDNIGKENLNVSKGSTSANFSPCNIASSPSSFLSNIYVCEEPDQLKIKSSNSPLSISECAVYNKKKNNCPKEIYDLEICNDMQKTTCELLSNENYAIKNSDLVVSSNEHKMNANYSRKRPTLEHEINGVKMHTPEVRKKQKISDISLSTNDIKSEKGVQINPINIKGIDQKAFDEPCSISCTLNKVNFDSSNCHHNSSHLVEECFDNELTCVLSSQVMNCRENVAGKKDYFESEAKGSSVFLCSSLRPPSDLSFSDSLQCSYTNFELPKFSSPTDICFSTETKEQNDVVTSDHCALKSENCIPFEVQSKLESCLHCSPEKTFNSSNLKHILSTELSSVLDAHYESPGKPQKDEGSKNSISVRFQISDGLKEVCESTGMKSVLFDDKVGLSSHKITSPFLENVEMHLPNHDEDASEVEVISVNNDDSVLLLSSLKKIETEDVLAHFNVNDTEENHESLLKDAELSDIIRDKDSSSSCKNSDHLNTNLQVSIAIDGLIHQVCKLDSASLIDVNDIHSAENSIGNNFGLDSEVFVIPETEFFGSDDTECSEVVESTSLTSIAEEASPLKRKVLEPESQNEAELHKVDKVSDELNFSDSEQHIEDFKLSNVKFKEQTNAALVEKQEERENQNCYPESEFIETNLLGAENSQDLGNYKSILVLPKENEDKAESSKEVHAKEDDESHLAFARCLNGTYKESVSDIQMIIFNDNTYVFALFITYVEVWRHQMNEEWLKIFVHQVDDALQLKKLSLLKNKDHLLLVLLLSSQQNHCLQFVLFERNSKIIKVLENSHWLNEGPSTETVLLCDLNGLMFATAQGDGIFKVFAHCFVDLNDNPRLVSLELGSTTNYLCSICKIQNLPNALMGISQRTLYVWHLLEARLVTAVTLQPRDFFSITECIWATVEKGLLLFITTSQDENNLVVSQLLAANLATGFCQTITPFDIRPARLNEKDSNRIVKAKYCEPYLVVSYKSTAFLWSVMDEHCCAVLDENHNVTAIAIGEDIEGYHLVAVGNKIGCINFYMLK